TSSRRTLRLSVLESMIVSSSWKRNLNSALRVHSLSGLHIEIRHRYLSRTLFREHPEGLSYNCVVPNLTAMSVAKHQDGRRVLYDGGGRLWRLLPQRLFLSQLLNFARQSPNLGPQV